MKILGEKIRHYRKLRGISQSELADGICTQATVSLIEKKTRFQVWKFWFAFVKDWVSQ
jgi:Helix-turn-helix.